MTYNGYTALINWSDEENCLVGNVIGIRHNILFRGSTSPEIYETFKEMIDWYLSECELDGIEPNPPPTEILVPVPIDLYAQAHLKAESKEIPIHQFLHEAIQQSVS
jgi:predicted HicB family RNase H-like nuclease